MQSNFIFLQTSYNAIYRHVVIAEQRVKTEPISAGFYCRLALEATVHAIYEENFLEKPYNGDLFSLMNQDAFRQLVPDGCYQGVMSYTRKIGNRASHGTHVASAEVLSALRYLYDFLKWFALRHSEEPPFLPGRFDETVIPKTGEHERKQREIVEENKKLLHELAELRARQQREQEALQEEQRCDQQRYEAFIAEKEEKISVLVAQQAQRDFSKLGHEYTEAQTRKLLIDVSLKEAGWMTLRKGVEVEYPVKGMPVTGDNPRGNGFADYVLWDDDGLPLAVIEAKRAAVNADNGRVQARLYANCLEQMTGQRPIIFYSNGYENYLWDDTFYPMRRIYGFLTREELKWRIQQRTSRCDLRRYAVNEAIAGRYYQKNAWKRVAEDFVKEAPDTQMLIGGKRQALLVMATGSGKTRTAAAMVDIMFRAGWVKRVLFLADRKALVHQAKKSFGEFLPNYSMINLAENREDTTTRLVFSTYQTMINKIDSELFEGRRVYGVGHFDLIILDEAHRSVYNKYKAIFDYFDACLIGLTATPKGEIDHNTFNLLGCPDEDPTFNYDLKQAVDDHFLVPPKSFELTTKFLRDGVKYSELSERDKAIYENSFLKQGFDMWPEELRNTEFVKWVFNKDTVYKILKGLMANGLKIEGGDKLGRTIIFAVNQKHAEFIVQCFYALYPEYAGCNFIEVIHNKVSHAQALIDSFCDELQERDPQIAVSVDMLDTGIDAPRVLNLVFFKIVRSSTKFWQMIGRGTRLCEDVYGPGMPKKEFYIFDTCMNFEYFDAHPAGATGNGAKSLSQQLFESRLQLSQHLAQTGDGENLAMAAAHLDFLYQQIKTLDRSRFMVQMNLRQVEMFSDRERWNNLSNEDIHIIGEHLSKLPLPAKMLDSARRFELLTFKMQVAWLMEMENKKRYADYMMNIADLLSKKYTVPEVLRSKALIEDMKEEAFYKDIKQRTLETIREEVRDLVKHLDREDKGIVFTEIQDHEPILNDGSLAYGDSNMAYKNRVERFVREHKHHITISKLNTNQPITREEVVELERIMFAGDKLGTKADFVAHYGEQPLGKFIRGIIGLDMHAAKDAFSDFLNHGDLTGDQIAFVDTLINYLGKNGTIDKAMLTQTPFTDRHHNGIMGVFKDPGKITRLVSIIDVVNDNAVA